jgi:hypothetical protein
MNFHNFSKYFCSNESLYILALIVIIILNLIFLSDKPNILLLSNIIVIIVYFIITKRNDKKILAITALNFAFWGVIIESFIIKKSNFALNYKKQTQLNFLYVPSWLFTVYIIFVIASLYTYECYKLLLT